MEGYSSRNTTMTQPLTVRPLSSGLISLALSGDLTHERVRALRDDITAAEALIREHAQSQADRRVRVLLDLTAFTGQYDVEAMEAMAAFARDNASHIERTAAFGASGAAAFAGEIVTDLANRDNIRFFPDEDAARAWLAE